MKGLLRIGCHVVVALWIAIYLAWPGAAPIDTVASEVRESQAQVRPLPESPPEPAAEAPAAAATSLAVGSEELSVGAALLDGGGSFPVLSFRYDGLGSFRDYALAMEGLGARFVVVRDRRIVGGIDVRTGAVGDADVDARFSPRARDYSDEPELARVAGEARRRFGERSEVMMLVPRGIDAGLFGGIARGLASRGDAHAAYREIRGRYERAPGGSLRVHIDAGERTDGGRVALRWVIDLAPLATGSS